MDMMVLDKLRILGEAAKFDVSCASSGVDRKGSGQEGTIGNSFSGGICHSFTPDGRCVSLLKVLLSNDCVFDCKYCINRRSADRPRASFTAREIAELTIEFYRRNYIEGLFLSSAVVKNPDYTMELMCEALRLLRQEMGFFGYIHIKAIPGADPMLLELAGRLADRMSVNIEFPSESGLKQLAPQKKKESIFGIMRYIDGRIEEDKGTMRYRQRIGGSSESRLRLTDGALPDQQKNGMLFSAEGGKQKYMPASYGKGSSKARTFTPGGQSTQMIIGATDDTDKTIIHLTEAMYKKLSLKRVYYSAYIPINKDPALPDGPAPLLREHRLYQADWLLRFYKFKASEILEDDNPNLDLEYDPKCTWALRHMEFFPVEINNADEYMLLRVPGIGPNSVAKILTARRTHSLDFEDLRKLRVVLKRARFFITCNGKHMGPLDADTSFIKANLSVDARSGTYTSQYVQRSFFDDENDPRKLLTGVGLHAYGGR